MFLTASIGVALSDAQGSAKAEEIIKDAEIAMYHAKKHRRRPHRGLPRGDARRPAGQARRSNRICAAPSSATSSRSCSSRSCVSRTAPLPASRRWCDGTTPSSAGWRRASSSPSPRRAASSSISACSCSIAAPANSRSGSAWSRAIRPIFCSVNVSSRQLLRHDLIHDLKAVLARSGPRAAAPSSSRSPRAW